MEEFVESDFEELKKQINEKKQGTIIGNIKDVSYEINLSKPLRVVFKDEKNQVEFYSGKLASSKIEINREEKRVHYRKKNVLNVGVTLIKYVYVIKSEINNKSYISEKYYIREQFDDSLISKKSEKIIEDLLINNKLESKNEGEFVRDKIDSDEELINLIHTEEDLDKYLVDGSKTKLGNFPSGFYEDRHDFEFNKKNENKKDIENNYEYYISLGEEGLEKYKELYLTIENIAKGEELLEKKLDNSEAEETLEIEQENKEEEIDETFNDVINEVVFELKGRKNNAEVNNTIEKQENLEKLNELKDEDDYKIDEVFIDYIVDGLKEKRKEEQKKQIRTDKINKVKELISLNKKLDQEIEIIEKSNTEEGEN